MPDPKPYHRTLEIRDFTCFHEAHFEFGSGINVFVGENGTGKTHVLKLLYTLHRMQFDGGENFNAFSKVFNVSRPDNLMRSRTEAPLISGNFGEAKWAVVLFSFDSHKEISDLL